MLGDCAEVISVVGCFCFFSSRRKERRPLTKEEGEEEPHVDMLELIIPVSGLAGVKADEGEAGEHILIPVNVVAVDVVRHVVMVAPHQAGGANEVIGEAKNLVPGRRLGQPAVVGAVI